MPKKDRKITADKRGLLPETTDSSIRPIQEPKSFSSGTGKARGTKSIFETRSKCVRPISDLCLCQKVSTKDLSALSGNLIRRLGCSDEVVDKRRRKTPYVRMIHDIARIGCF